MKRLLIAIAAVAVIGLAPTPATGDQTKDAYMTTQIVNVVQIRDRVRERIRERLQQRYRKQVAALELEAAPVVPEPTVSTPAPAPTYDTSSTSWQLSEAEVASYLRAAGFPESVIPTMVSIAQRESNLCATAVYGYGCGGTGHAVAGGPACGLLQLFPCPGPDALDPARNAALAYSKYQASGLSPWGG